MANAGFDLDSFNTSSKSKNLTVSKLKFAKSCIEKLIKPAFDIAENRIFQASEQ